MTQAQPHIIGRYRGTWRSGEQYLPDDKCVVAQRTFRCLVNHVSGPRAMPGTGENWPAYWYDCEGYVENLYPVAASGPAGAASAVTHPPFALQLQSLPANVVPLLPPLAPARLTPTSSIGPLEVSSGSDLAATLELESVKARLARQEQDVARMQELVGQLAKRIGSAALAPPGDDDPIRAEAWRRKADVLGALDRASAEALFSQMLAQGYTLLRKRDKGETWTAQEAARAAVLDTLHAQCAAIDDAAANLEQFTPGDISADRHWPLLGDAS